MDNFKDNETDIQHLIISSLEGTASEEELLVLQKWLEESEQHFLLFHAYRQDWIQAGCVQRYQTGEAWKKVERRLFHRMPVKHLFLWTRIAGYAALVVLMIAVGYVFMRRDQDKNRAYVVEGNIEPGGKKAILVLGSDEKVVLGDEAEETLLAGNTTVKKEGNTLVYDRQKNGEGEEEYNRLITPRGGEYAVVLADGVGECGVGIEVSGAIFRDRTKSVLEGRSLFCGNQTGNQTLYRMFGSGRNYRIGNRIQCSEL